MEKKPITIIINNYKGKRITIAMPIDSSIEIYQETVIADMLDGISDIKIHAKGKNITIEVEDFEDNQKYQSIKDIPSIPLAPRPSF